MKRDFRLKITHQLLMALLAILALTIWLAYFTFRQMEEIDQHVRDLDDQWIPATRLVAEMKAEFFNFRLSEFQLTSAEGKQELAGAEQRLGERLVAYRDREQQLGGLLANTGLAARFAEVSGQMQAYLVASTRLLELSRQGQRAAALALLTEPSRDMRNDITARLDQLADATLDAGKAARQAGDAAFLHARVGTLLTCAIAVLLVVVMGGLLGRAMLRTVRQLQQAGVSTASSSTQMSAAIREQEATLAEQSASTAEIAASVKEISATARQLSQDVDQIAQLSEVTSEEAQASRQGLAQLDQTMRRMLEALAGIVNKLALLNDKASNINGIVTTINKVADQTNLLSLNAAIQAEKAGDGGLGFGVVASEIRRLSDQTAVTTSDIEDILKDMQAAVSGSVMGMERFSAEIHHTVDAVHQMGQQLTQAIEHIQAIGPRIETIQEGMQAQSLGSEQIAQAMLQFSAGMRQTLEAVRGSQHSITLLTEAVHDVQGAVARL